MFCGLVKRHESLKKYIKTVIDQLPKYIVNYPPGERKLLKEFLTILAYYEEADFNREELGNKFESYRQEIISHKNFVILPFFWFIETYFRNAHVSLSVSKFHSVIFYEYVVKHLRGAPQIEGVFKLIQGGVSLSNLKWEELQYECNKLTTPLTSGQLKIINAVYSCNEELGVRTLDSKRLRTEIVSKTDQPNSTKDLHRFFKLINGQWSIRFFSPAFGLDRYFFHFQVKENKTLSDVIDFQDPANTVIGLSDVYYTRDSVNSYYGTFYLPSKHYKRIKNYLKQYEKSNYLRVKAFSRINEIYNSVSFTYYQANNGWEDLSPAKITRLTKGLFSQKAKENQLNENSLYISTRFNNIWNFTSHPLPLDLINLYCKLPQQFFFINLPFDSFNNQASFTLSRTEIGLLKQLTYNKVANITFIPWRLVYEFSLDLYIIILPKISQSQLKRFLILLPFSDIYITETSIIIWTRLTQNFAQWIQEQPNWTIKDVILANYPLDLSFEWFDEETLQWNLPNILT